MRNIFSLHLGMRFLCRRFVVRVCYFALSSRMIHPDDYVVLSKHGHRFFWQPDFYDVIRFIAASGSYEWVLYVSLYVSRGVMVELLVPLGDLIDQLDPRVRPGTHAPMQPVFSRYPCLQ